MGEAWVVVVVEDGRNRKRMSVKKGETVRVMVEWEEVTDGGFGIKDNLQKHGNLMILNSRFSLLHYIAGRGGYLTI